MAAIKPRADDSKEPALSQDAPGVAYLDAVSSWQLTQPLGTTPGAFTATLATTDTTAIWLAQFIQSPDVTISGTLSSADPTRVVVAGLECDLIVPGPQADMPTSLSLHFSTAVDLLQRQFGSLGDVQSGLHLFDIEAGILFAVADSSSSQSVSVGTLITLGGVYVSPWALSIMRVVPVQLRLPTSSYYPRNGLWVFAAERQLVLRLEFALPQVPAALMAWLPEHSAVTMTATVKKTAQFRVIGDEPEVAGEVFLAGSISFTTTDASGELDLFIFLGHNGTTFTVQNEGTLGFIKMTELFVNHLEQKLAIPGAKDSFGALTDRLNNHLSGQGTFSMDRVHWREISLTLEHSKLQYVTLVLEVETPIGVPSGTQSAFILRFQWSIPNGDIQFTGRFWSTPAGMTLDAPKMPLAYRLNPAQEDHAILRPVSSITRPTLSLSHIHPSISIEHWPHWLPEEIKALEITLGTTEISFQAVVQSRGAGEETDGDGPPELPFTEDTKLEIEVQYTPKTPNSLVFKVEACVQLHAVGLLPAQLDLSAAYETGKWVLTASAKNLQFKHLASLLPASSRAAIPAMMPAASLPSLEVKYTNGQDKRVLTVEGYLLLGGLLLSFTLLHTSTGTWRLLADLRSNASQVAGKATTVGDLLGELLGDSIEEALPPYVANIEVPLSELTDDGITLVIGRAPSSSEHAGQLVFSLEIHLASLHIDLTQIAIGHASPKRMLRVSIHEFPHVPDIPLIGPVPQPFDQIAFLWTNVDLTLGDIDQLNTLLLSEEGNELLYRATQQTDPSTVVLRKGFHFTIAMNKDGQPVVVLDYVFGGKPPASLKDAEHSKDETEKPKEVSTGHADESQEKDKAQESAGDQADSKDTEEISPSPPSEKVAIAKKSKALTITNVGLQMTGHTLTVHLNATLRLGPIALTLTGFALHFDMTHVQLPRLVGLEPTWSLDGLAIAYDRNPVHIAGMFVRQSSSSATTQTTTFGGGVIIGLSKYNFAAVGAYSEVKSKDGSGGSVNSFFVFGALTGPLMQFEFAELRGISGGFGYHSFVNMPKPEDVTNFPFLTMSSEGVSDPLKTLADFTDTGTIVPQPGVLWLAAGVKMRAFEVLDVTAVLALQLTLDNVLLTLLGDARATVPQSAPSVDKAFAMLEFGLSATLDFGHGTLLVQGTISSQSFLLSHACHPQGGFALGVWGDKSAHPGDMCLTIGGFHGAFARPEHYPNPPRLGISWVFDKHISITGEAYFAITPAAVMAGGKLEVLCTLDKLSAHFDAHADFLVEFEPFHYEATVGVMAAVTYELKVWRLTKKANINLGANLDLHGPSMAGTAHFSFWFMTFEVSFGTSDPPSPPKTLQGFWDMLSTGSPGTDNHIMAIEDGLVADTKKSKSTVSKVRAGSLAMAVYSRVPISSATFAGTDKITGSQSAFSRPMQLTESKFTSTIDFTITPDPGKHFQMEKLTKLVPASIWGPYSANKSSLLRPSDNQTIEHTMGVRLVPPKTTPSPDKLPELTADFFGTTSQLTGELSPSETEEKLKPASPSQQAETDPFLSVQQAWHQGGIIVDLSTALGAFAKVVADVPGFGTQHSPAMQPNAGWTDLVNCSAPPKEYIDDMDEYFLRPPAIMVM